MRNDVLPAVGPLDISGTRFVEEKRRLGYGYRSEAFIVAEFSRFASKHFEYATDTSIVSRKMVEAWLQSKEELTAKSMQLRMVVIRQFAKFLVRSGEEAYVLPFGYSPKAHSSFVPYILTEHQILCIFAAADRLKPIGLSPGRHLVIPLILRMLYGCGLRVSEATHLQIADVDLTNGILMIRNSKFQKTRAIPMAESLRLRCCDYFQMMHQKSRPEDFFFPNAWREEYSPASVRENFHALWEGCGFPQPGPRLHDLRHTYAVHTLKKWSETGRNLHALLPLLSFYLGHNDLSGTQKYLRLTADMYPHVIGKVESAYGDIFPNER